MYAPEALAALTERLEIGIFASGPNSRGVLPVPADALAQEIVNMRGGQRRTHLMTDDPGLGGRQTRATREQPVRPLDGTRPRHKGGAPMTGGSCPARETAAGALSGGNRLGDERRGPLTPHGADATWPRLKGRETSPIVFGARQFVSNSPKQRNVWVPDNYSRFSYLSCRQGQSSDQG